MNDNAFLRLKSALFSSGPGTPASLGRLDKNKRKKVAKYLISSLLEAEGQ